MPAVTSVTPSFRIYDPVTGTYVEKQTLPPVPVQTSVPTVQTWSVPQPAYNTPVTPKTTVRAARKKRQDPLDSFTKSVVNSAGRTLGNELTRGLILNPDWYWQMNFWSLMDYDLQAMSNILLNGSDRGFVNGDEWRDRMHMPPAGLKEFRVLENYIPNDKSGEQKKLNPN